MPTRELSVLIIDDNAPRAAIIEAGLREAGHDRVAIVRDVTGVAAEIAQFQPDVIMIALENPNRDMLENLFQLTRAVKRPIAMFVDRSDQDAMEQAIEAGVSAYVVNGLRRERIKPVLDVAITRFKAFSRLEREVEDARNALQSRKSVDRAKGLLMRSRGLSEDEAYALLRRTAMNQNRKIGDVAKSLIMAAELLDDGGGRGCDD